MKLSALFRRKPTFPTSINIHQHGVIPIEQEPLVEEQWGFYDPKRNRIVIKEDLEEVQKYIVLTHQMLDMSRHLLGVNDVKTFTQALPLLLLHMQADAGMLAHLTDEMMRDYIINQADTDAREKSDA